MPAARLSHGFVFVKQLEPMVRFYEGAFGMTCRRSSHPGFVTMEAPDGAGVALHALPAPIAEQSCLAQPPRWREDTAYKLCFATDDLDGLRAAILAHGGQAKEPWAWEETRFCECTDPEGNVVQVFTPPPTSPDRRA
jgi:predicted enzyme related to lactoylglutathione lyase